MSLPFTADQFFDVFAAYNAALWPVVVALWIGTLVAIVRLIRGHASHKMLFALLAFHWAWSGVVYHGVFFTRINPAAWLFAAFFTVQAAGFLWFGLRRGRLRFEWHTTRWRAVAAAFLALSLAYPFLSLWSGHPWPRVPAFAVPCPTTLLTTGLLLTLTLPAPRWLFAIPIAWSFVGGSAALALGVTPDLLLFAGAACLMAWIARRRGSRGNSPPSPF